MLATSQTDAMVAGANSASSSVGPLLQVIPFQNKNKLISSLNIFDLEARPLVRIKNFSRRLRSYT